MRTLALSALLVLGPMTAAIVPAVAVAQTPADEAKAQAALRKTIADFQAGTPDYASMSPDLATAVKAQEASMAQLTPLGPVTAVARIGDGVAPYKYSVTFTAGVTLTWSITLDADGKISGLLVG